MIYVKDLWKRFNDHFVLKGLNLEIKQGETLVILGRSGSGKSVLLRHMMGIEKPDKGMIEINGVDITQLKEKDFYPILRGMGMLFQAGALFDSLTVKENTAFYLFQHPDRK
jgi:phospholipid/cholesterol/gamma-HCH transport system ATP-binding protein